MEDGSYGCDIGSFNYSPSHLHAMEFSSLDLGTKAHLLYDMSGLFSESHRLKSGGWQRFSGISRSETRAFLNSFTVRTGDL